MRISHVHIENFRNFKIVDVELSKNIVIVGENQVGKSNFIYALRLVLDPTLSDQDRQLTLSDFWDGIGVPTKDDYIKISVDFTDFIENTGLASVMGDFLVSSNPITSRLTYIYRPIPGLDHEPNSEEDYEFLIYGGEKEERQFGYDKRKRIPLSVVNALRDAENDLSTWSKSPLKYLLNEIARKIDKDELKKISDNIKTTSDQLKDNGEIKQLVTDINLELENILGQDEKIDTSLGFIADDPQKLIRTLKVLVDGEKRTIHDSSLGIANVLYISLKNLEINKLIEDDKRDYSFFCIEEPEAHLHPHFQRMVYRSFLEERKHQSQEDISEEKKTVILTTHSPHIISVTPIKSIVLLKKDRGGFTNVYSASNMSLSQSDIDDLERYLDVTRGEMLFAKRVILVEGDAEEFIVPALAKHLDIDLDEKGITICSVKGTNFKPYVKLLEKLHIPYSILTDFDPQDGTNPLSYKRVIGILEVKLNNNNLEQSIDTTQFLNKGKEQGIFVNNNTLEIDLFRAGRHKSMTYILHSLTENNAAKERAQKWNNDPQTFDEQQFIKDINEVGKGRFAQAYAVKLLNQIKENNKFPQYCPTYIKEAIEYVLNK